MSLSLNDTRAVLSNTLPVPKNAVLSQRLLNETDRVNKIIKETSGFRTSIPNYGFRKDFFPRLPEDFGDGGAFPEIHYPQYPLNMGKQGSNTSVVPLTVGQDSRLNYGLLAKIGHDKDRVVFSNPEDSMARGVTENDSFPRPSDEAITEITEKTRDAIEKIINIRISSTKPKDINASNLPETFVRYVSREVDNKAVVGERIIRMVETKIDPLEPAKFKHKKVAPLGGSPPAPVLHSPPRKATAEEQRAWYVPPSISNWKNPKGYTIPLDKRLASDGRGLKERVVNEKFATFAEALYIAEQYAREEVTARNTLEKKLMEKEKREKEEELRKLAERAKLARDNPPELDVDEDTASVYSRRTGTTAISGHFESYEERERIRRERAVERERELRLSRMGTAAKQQYLDRDRDVAEKIALGMNVSAPKDSSEIFDLRLFHQTGPAGLSSGYHGGEDDRYDVYDRPLFQSANAAQLLYYRPKRDLDGDLEGITTQTDIEEHRENIKRVKNLAGEPVSAKAGPVEFEKTTTVADSEDVFGLNKFLEDARRGRKE